jgi:FG-GAP repeat
MKRIVLIIGLALLVGATALLAADAVAPVAPRGSTSVSFATAVTITSPAIYPFSIAAGDLNHNGFPDLAVVSRYPADFELNRCLRACISTGRTNLWKSA